MRIRLAAPILILSTALLAVPASAHGHEAFAGAFLGTVIAETLLQPRVVERSTYVSGPTVYYSEAPTVYYDRPATVYYNEPEVVYYQPAPRVRIYGNTGYQGRYWHEEHHWHEGWHNDYHGHDGWRR